MLQHRPETLRLKYFCITYAVLIWLGQSHCIQDITATKCKKNGQQNLQLGTVAPFYQRPQNYTYMALSTCICHVYAAIFNNVITMARIGY